MKRTQRAPSQLENYCTCLCAQLSQLISQNPQLRKPALPSGAKLSVFQSNYIHLMLSQQKYKRLLRISKQKVEKIKIVYLTKSMACNNATHKYGLVAKILIKILQRKTSKKGNGNILHSLDMELDQYIPIKPVCRNRTHFLVKNMHTPQWW